ncbi:FliH/SctL family protein [Engelhardtia mirabilis]|uniref:Flagellar assembly protein FliH n=1 Tax=Engelhardtia mirabilis TaxID=2528011 RepID=A0A518BST6_9BACT|nr:flagellar assembly protein H [Planctomycetes bacterium Pla133]QDV04353.1 flagellar assembly protein H [Planctomycetes bacterium Pla86]
MSSSLERLPLGLAPSGVRVRQISYERALEALTEERAQARADAAASEARSRTDAEVRAELTASVDAVIEATLAEREQVENAITESAVAIALEIARQVLRTELEAGRYELEGVVRECLARGTQGRGACQVYVCPSDHERLKDMRLRAATELLVDPGLAAGEVRVESPQGLVVRDPLSVLERITEALGEALRS